MAAAAAPPAQRASLSGVRLPCPPRSLDAPPFSHRPPRDKSPTEPLTCRRRRTTMLCMDRAASTRQRTHNVTIRITAEEREAWTAAAAEQDRPLSSWLRWLAAREVGRRRRQRVTRR